MGFNSAFKGLSTAKRSPQLQGVEQYCSLAFAVSLPAKVSCYRHVMSCPGQDGSKKYHWYPLGNRLRGL